jgi:hypothetical protein
MGSRDFYNPPDKGMIHPIAQDGKSKEILGAGADLWLNSIVYSPEDFLHGTYYIQVQFKIDVGYTPPFSGTTHR